MPAFRACVVFLMLACPAALAQTRTTFGPNPTPLIIPETYQGNTNSTQNLAPDARRSGTFRHDHAHSGLRRT